MCITWAWILLRALGLNLVTFDFQTNFVVLVHYKVINVEHKHNYYRWNSYSCNLKRNYPEYWYLLTNQYLSKATDMGCIFILLQIVFNISMSNTTKHWGPPWHKNCLVRIVKIRNVQWKKIMTKTRYCSNK